MNSLPQALIPGIIGGFRTNESLQATLVEKVTSGDTCAPWDRRYDDTRTYALTRKDTRDPNPAMQLVVITAMHLVVITAMQLVLVVTAM